MNILRAEHIVKRFGKRTVVDDACIHVQSGEVVGLLGPNGAGKTTSFYMMVGLIPVSKGHIYLNQQDITHLPIHDRAKQGIGYLPQEPELDPEKDVRGNVEEALSEITDAQKRLDEVYAAYAEDRKSTRLNSSHR